ncbi:MAG: hypothetical protein QOE28_1482 [Solirubrobacteraceae bacterium]|nr:hypothetical protein [Solirubrobacteraceae bacterium]
MSAVEQQPQQAPAPAPEPRRCPRCGAQLSREQEWCLDCGTGVGTVIAAPRGWRAPLVAVGVLVAIALAALILALVELARPAERVVPVAATPTPAAAAPAPAASATPAPGAAGSATPAPTAAPPSAANLAVWPAGKSAWTIILNSRGTKADAEKLASDLAGRGIQGVGVLNSNNYQSLGPDSFIVFSGVYPNKTQAEDALATIRDRAGGGSSRRIVPKKK